ncbi:MAG: hypothetical protein A3G33_10435 [Omnitrophica bacterium RIFCSPLOWO2_12_FULL_44_17]|uniref:Hemin transporter HemP n=1 Tax=Candidatus Danuiimicrobium aquiferis TaxID=1801832 RepID=A0A1G1KRG5_9BACT|nr:MAG: hypothetical protein A3B72_02750 [Omnitrophica bacterium RIFCSPHIGHO2_02_FULL_45_28]OGW95392.1 MAG: hypothetical protein A3G33_10435 [Omnitrophica bacterium RIFCSPLOWO2_12_FULL_44_17]OGX03277.1 MAG: hypothetical protein A3J12_07065 [Omnitrophica bacterium RIFCSPLOWO2_02_FULL_44_11]
MEENSVFNEMPVERGKVSFEPGSQASPADGNNIFKKDFLGRYTAEELFQGRREISITHNGQEYRLKKTRAEKLILNK